MKDTLPNRVRLGAFELDLRAGVVRAGEEGVCLQQQPFFVLRMLVERGGDIVTRDEIQTKLWPNDTAVDFDQGINAAIRKLRQALGDSAEKPTYIETLARRGYRLMVPVEALGPAPLGQHSSDPDEIAKQPTSPSANVSGKTVSHYRVLEIVGGGGMGVVYRAEDLKLGRAVALKFLPEELSDDPKALERFEREARAASALDHPNICSIYEFGEHEGQPFIVMQLLEGRTLRDHLAAHEAALSLREVLNIAVQVANGLEGAHEKGIIHRDIKPANIFLTTRGLVKILDFGVAKLIKFADTAEVAPGGDGPAVSQCATDRSLSTLSLTRTGLSMGTAGYMSPEQVRGEAVDPRTDLFSFGLVLYEMATGQRAFGGDTAAIVREAILTQTPAPVRERNSTVPPKLEQIINQAINKDRERRYQGAAEMGADLQSLTADQSSQSGGLKLRERPRWRWLAFAAVVCVAIIAGGVYWYRRSHRAPKLTERDTIVLADFDNETGDAVFDDALKQGLLVQLGQSPFLDLVSERKVNQTLRQMGRHAGDRLTPEVTREVCQRAGSKAMLNASIAEVSSQYVIGLKVVDCNMGDVLAEVKERATGKEAVLKVLDKAAVSLRSKLGESLSSVEKYATPLEEGTTPSLEALKAFSLGRKIEFTNGWTAALPFYNRAVELDPNFAKAYAAMATTYANLNELGRATGTARKAYELRERVSERERLAIEGTYYLRATGELGKAAQTYDLWQQTYPRDVVPYGNLGFIYASLGNMDGFLEESREAMRLESSYGTVYLNLAAAYENLNRLDEAEAVFKQAEERKLVAGERLLQYRYLLAFLKGDTVQMAQLAAAAVGRPGTEDLLLASQADTEAWHGRLKSARELTLRATDSAQRNDAKETAAAYQAAAALREVAVGNRQQARADAKSALVLAPGRHARQVAALSLALAGDTEGAEKLAAELDKAFPLDTLVQRYWLPTIRAAVALDGKDPNRAVELLKPTIAMDLALVNTGANIFLCPVYVRGEAYLILRDGNAAAAEFQKFIDHYGLLTNFPWGALARLGLARAYALDAAKDPAAREKARTAYQNFLTLWKDADPDIPIYKQAKAEYAKLQ